MTLSSYLLLKLLFLSLPAQQRSAIVAFNNFPPIVLYDKSVLADDYVPDEDPTPVVIALTPLELYHLLRLLEDDRRERFNHYIVDISSPILSRLCEPLDARQYRDKILTSAIQRCKRGSW